MGFFSLAHESLTKYVPCGPKQILTWVYFHSAWFLTNWWVHFPQPRITNIAIGFVSLGLENLKKYVPRFSQPSAPKQNLTCVYFPSACFLKNYGCPFCSASRHQHMYDLCPLAWSTTLTSASLSPPLSTSKPKPKTRSVSQNPI